MPSRKATNYKVVTAIVRRSRLNEVEERLKREGVRGITVAPVKGYGEYANYFGRDLLVPHVRVEVVVVAGAAGAVAEAIADEAHTGQEGDGLVLVSPLEMVTRIRTRTRATKDDL
jgi:nitrogen regulatory protein PII